VKKIRGKLVCFGPWDDPDGALEKYLKEKDDLHAGRMPRVVSVTGVRVKHLTNAFLIHKKGTARIGRHLAADLGELQGNIRHAGGQVRQVAFGDGSAFRRLRGFAECDVQKQ
jgi:hypothetical protein